MSEVTFLDAGRAKNARPLYNEAEADIYELFQQRDPETLIELDRRDPKRFTQFQHSYLMRLAERSRIK